MHLLPSDTFDTTNKLYSIFEKSQSDLAIYEIVRKSFKWFGGRAIFDICVGECVCECVGECIGDTLNDQFSA